MVQIRSPFEELTKAVRWRPRKRPIESVPQQAATRLPLAKAPRRGRDTRRIAPFQSLFGAGCLDYRTEM